MAGRQSARHNVNPPPKRVAIFTDTLLTLQVPVFAHVVVPKQIPAFGRQALAYLTTVSLSAARVIAV